MSLAGARPKGPRPDLVDGPQKALLTRLHELNNPYRVSYEMVARQLWADDWQLNLQRSRTRDLSRQFRGDKPIDWRVIEVYAALLYPDDERARAAELAICLDLYHRAFGVHPEEDGTPSAEQSRAGRQKRQKRQRQQPKPPKTSESTAPGSPVEPAAQPGPAAAAPAGAFGTAQVTAREAGGTAEVAVDAAIRVAAVQVGAQMPAETASPPGAGTRPPADAPFGAADPVTPVAPADSPPPAADPSYIDPAYVAELERQLEQARTRAAIATALLVVVQAENATLRGKNRTFAWFTPPPGRQQSAQQRDAGRAADAAGRPGGRGRGDGETADTRRQRRYRPTAAAAGVSDPIEPATAPIPRRQGHRTQRHRRPAALVSPVGDSVQRPPPVPGPSAPGYSTPGYYVPASVSAALLARSREAWSASRRSVPGDRARLADRGIQADPDGDALGMDILVSHEKRSRDKRRRGKGR